MIDTDWSLLNQTKIELNYNTGTVQFFKVGFEEMRHENDIA